MGYQTREYASGEYDSLHVLERSGHDNLHVLERSGYDNLHVLERSGHDKRKIKVRVASFPLHPKLKIDHLSLVKNIEKSCENNKFLSYRIAWIGGNRARMILLKRNSQSRHCQWNPRRDIILKLFQVVSGVSASMLGCLLERWHLHQHSKWVSFCCTSDGERLLHAGFFRVERAASTHHRWW